MNFVTIFLALVAGGLITAGSATAETGSHPHLDNACTTAAFASDSPTVIIGAREPRTVIQHPPVGLRAKNAYCSGPEFKHPADYGSAPEPVVGP